MRTMTAAKVGWNMISTPATKKNEGTTGGAAVLTTHWMGLCYLDGEDTGTVVPGRAVAAKWQAPGMPPTRVASLYLKSGGGLGKENLDILEKEGETSRSTGAHQVRCRTKAVRSRCSHGGRHM